MIQRILFTGLALLLVEAAVAQKQITLNEKDTGYRGIWYMNQPLKNEYKYKYSGGLGTYCAKHKPFAVYCEKAEKTFFCYGGTTEDSNSKLIHMVSYFDHRTGKVPRPTRLLDKGTSDAHDNPVIAVDDAGYIWIFSTSHGTGRPSYIHRSKKPYDIEAFELVKASRLADGKEVPIDNFSYLQAWHPKGRGFTCFFTKYGWGAGRTICYMTSEDGEHWSEWKRIATMEKGHYQISTASARKAASAFNYHPQKGGLNYRTNLYYVETPDLGKTWHAADGSELQLPLEKVKNPALVKDYEAEGLKVYLKDIRFDADSRPVILYITSRGFASGPENGPRTWTTARWTGTRWDFREMATSDNNYDMGSLYIDDDGTWRVIGPTEVGPQPFNTGGEVALWESKNQGESWTRVREVTRQSKRNHTYCRAPVNAHPDFYALWADGHGREPSTSNLYFCNSRGDLFELPREMHSEFEAPKRIK